MSDASGRFGWPFIQPGQAQKEAFHNEALVGIDMLLHPLAEALGLETPPATAAVGQGWIVGANPSGAWAGQGAKLAVMTDGGWRFAAPTSGMAVWLRDQALWAHWTGSAWSAGDWPVASVSVGGQQVIGARQAAIATVTGGTTIDANARTALNKILTTLRTHGLIAS